MRGARQPRPDRGRRGLDRRGNLGPVHQAPPIAKFNRAILRLTDQHGTPRGRQPALPGDLEVPRRIPHDPIVGEDAGLLELQHAIERAATRGPPMKVVGRGGRDGKAPVVLGQIRLLEQGIRRCRVGDLETTQPDLETVLDLVKTRADSPCLEVETYTWDVLPPEYRTAEMSEAIARELAWTRARLEA